MGKVYHVMHLQLCKCTWYTRDVLCTWRVDCLVTLGAHFYDLPEPIYRPLMHWCYGENLFKSINAIFNNKNHSTTQFPSYYSACRVSWLSGMVERWDWVLWLSTLVLAYFQHCPSCGQWSVVLCSLFLNHQQTTMVSTHCSLESSG